MERRPRARESLRLINERGSVLQDLHLNTFRRCISRPSREKSVEASASPTRGNLAVPAPGPLGSLDTCREGTPSALWRRWSFLVGRFSFRLGEEKIARVSVFKTNVHQARAQESGVWDQNLHSCKRGPNAGRISRDESVNEVRGQPPRFKQTAPCGSAPTQKNSTTPNTLHTTVDNRLLLHLVDSAEDGVVKHRCRSSQYLRRRRGTQSPRLQCVKIAKDASLTTTAVQQQRWNNATVELAWRLWCG